MEPNEERKDSERLLLRVTTAAKMLDVSKSQLYMLISRGEIPAIRVGRSIRIPLDWLQEWIAGQPKV
jgi:excisionase family DNA binding protein